MYGDFTRDTYSHARETHISRVLMQQGRVLLDADWNLQVGVFWRYLRALAADIIGPHGGSGFEIGANNPADEDFVVGAGHYYVDGILCENGPAYSYRASRRTEEQRKKQLESGNYLVFLDVWEQQVQDDYFREKALNGVDTTLRVQVAWSVELLAMKTIDERVKEELDALTARQAELTGEIGRETNPARKTALQNELADVQSRARELNAAFSSTQADCDEVLSTVVLRQGLISPCDAWLRARLDPGTSKQDPCILPPGSGYRGTENQLYRVEVHRGGGEDEATLKWSRDNAHTATAWLGVAENALLVRSARGFEAGQWVELTHDGLGEGPGQLVKIGKVEDDRLTFDPAEGSPQFDREYRNPLVRRWDQAGRQGGTIPVKEGLPTGWIDLEHGIQVQFRRGGSYCRGDHWLIPARIADGTIEWPSDGDPNGLFQLPHGVEHHYAPLALIGVAADGTVDVVADYRRTIKQIAD